MSDQTKTKTLEQKYPWIVKWSRHMGSYDYYIESLLDMAEADNAPPNAIYKRGEQWVTTDHLINPVLRKQWGLPALQNDTTD